MKALRGKADFFVVEIPEWAVDYKISGTNYLCFKDSNGKWIVDWGLPYSLNFIWKLSKISEKDADDLVERYGIDKGELISDHVFAEKDILYGYKNYINNMTVQPHEFSTAKESLRSLFIANNFDMEKDYIIITLVDNISMSWQNLARLLDDASWDIFEKYIGEDEPKYGFRELFPVISTRDELNVLLNKFKR